MLSAQQKVEAQKRLKILAEEQQAQKSIKNKIKNVSKLMNQKLKHLSEGDPKKACQILAKLNDDQLIKFLIDMQSKGKFLVDEQEKLKNQKQNLNREKMNAIDDKQRYGRAIVQIKDTIIKIQKAIQQSVKEEQGKRKRIQQDLDKSILEIKQKIISFQKQSVELQEQNKVLQAKKQEILKKMGGLEQQFKSKAQQKDQLVKKDKEGLMQNLKQVQNQVNEATQLNKQFSTLEKKNFDNKLSIYLRTKKFPQICNSMENSATTIDKCKQELTKGVQRLLRAMQTTKKCEQQSKQINQKCLQKLKLKSQKQDKLKQIKSEKQQIRLRIIELQNKKKLKMESLSK